MNTRLRPYRQQTLFSIPENRAILEFKSPPPTENMDDSSQLTPSQKQTRNSAALTGLLGGGCLGTVIGSSMNAVACLVVAATTAATGAICCACGATICLCCRPRR